MSVLRLYYLLFLYYWQELQYFTIEISIERVPLHSGTNAPRDVFGPGTYRR